MTNHVAADSFTNGEPFGAGFRIVNESFSRLIGFSISCHESRATA